MLELTIITILLLGMRLSYSWGKSDGVYLERSKDLYQDTINNAVYDSEKGN